MKNVILLEEDDFELGIKIAGHETYTCTYDYGTVDIDKAGSVMVCHKPDDMGYDEHWYYSNTLMDMPEECGIVLPRGVYNSLRRRIVLNK